MVIRMAQVHSSLIYLHDIQITFIPVMKTHLIQLGYQNLAKPYVRGQTLTFYRNKNTNV